MAGRRRRRRGRNGEDNGLGALALLFIAMTAMSLLYGIKYKEAKADCAEDHALWSASKGCD